MRSIHDFETGVPEDHGAEKSRASRRKFWDDFHRRYEELRYGMLGRIIGYVAAFTLILLLIFTVIMILESHRW